MAFHFGATCPKERVRLDCDRKVYERDADSGYRIRFHFCPSCGTTLYWDCNPAVCGVAVGAFDTSAFPPPSDSIWEESKHPWLGLPPRMEHHQQGRPRLYESRAQLFDHHEQHLEIGLSQNLFEIISEDTRTDSFVAQRLDSLFMNQSISRISV